MDWFKLYCEARRDRKLAALNDSQHRVWFNLLCFAAEQPGDERGSAPAANETLLAVEVANGDVDLLRSTLALLERLEIVGASNGRITFLKFRQRQYDKPSDEPAQVRARVAAHRQRRRQEMERRETPVTPPTNGSNAHVTLGNALERDTESEEEGGTPPLTPPTPDADAPAGVRVAPKPTKSGELIDLVRAEGVPIEMQPRDHAALKKTALSPAQVSEAYCAAFRGEWGGEWLQENLSVQRVVERWAGYVANREAAARPPPRKNGRLTAVEAVQLWKAPQERAPVGLLEGTKG